MAVGILAVALTASAAAASADAASRENAEVAGARHRFPVIDRQLRRPAWLPRGARVRREPSGYANVVVSGNVPGMMAVSDRAIVDEAGRPRDPQPLLRRVGDMLTPRGPASYGLVAIPAATGNEVLVGDSLFAGVRLELASRREVRPVVGRGHAFYPSGVSGGSVLDVVLPDGVQEWVILDGPRSPRTLRYRLGLPAGATARKEGVDVVVRDRVKRPIVGISAPVAVDAGGRPLPVSLALTRGVLLVRLPTLPADVRFPIAVDPYVHRLGPTTNLQGVDGYYELNQCNHLTTPPPIDPCDNRLDGQGPEGGYSALGDLGMYDVTFGSPQPLGVSTEPSQAFAAGSSAQLRLDAPVDLVLVGSNFEGYHSFQADEPFQCELIHRDMPPEDLDRGDPSGNDRWFVRNGEWALYPGPTFELDDFEPGPARKRAEDLDLNHWMRGTVQVRLGDDLRPLHDLRWVALRMFRTGSGSFTTGSAVSYCRATFQWNTIFYDVYDPDPDAPEIVPARSWYGPGEEVQVRFHGSDRGSGGKWATLEHRPAPDPPDDPIPGYHTISQYLICDGDLKDFSDPTNFKLEGRDTPCDLRANGQDAQTLGTRQGVHGLRWTMEDFTGRIARAATTYRVDATRPACEIGAVTPQKNGWVTSLTPVVPVRAEDAHSGVGGVRVWWRPASGGAETLFFDGAFTGWLNLSPTLPDDGSYVIRVEVTDVVGNTTNPDCSLTINVDPTPPASAQIEAVRGATGERARWRPVRSDTGGTDDFSDQFTYRWEARLNDAAGPVVCRGTTGQPTPLDTVSGWIETELCRNRVSADQPAPATDFAPGTRLYWTLKVVDAAEHISAATNDTETVDQRPRAFRASGTGTRYFNEDDQLSIDVNGQPLPSTVYEQIVVRVTDPDDADDTDPADGAPDDADLTHPNIVDGAEAVRPDQTRIGRSVPERNAPRDFAQVVVTIDDPNDASPAPDASARIVWTSGRTDAQGAATSPRRARVFLDEPPYESVPFAAEQPPAGVPSCFPGERTAGGGELVLQGTYWEINCTDLAEAASTDAAGYRGLDLTLPVRPRDGTPYPTPDQRYDLSVWVRDRAQQADYHYLSNATTNSVTDPAPPAREPTTLTPGPAPIVQPNADPAVQAGAIPIGPLALDRIDPDGLIVYPDADPTFVRRATIVFRADAADIVPGSTTAPVSARTITTSPLTLDPTGVQSVTYTVYQRAPNGANIDGDANPANGITPLLAETPATSCLDNARATQLTLPVTGATILRDCSLSWTHNLTATTDTNVVETVTDIAGNTHQTTRWLRVIDPGGLCTNINGQTPRLVFDDFAQAATPGPIGYPTTANYVITRDTSNGNQGNGNANQSLRIQCTGNPNSEWRGGLAITTTDPNPNGTFTETKIVVDVPTNGRPPDAQDEYQETLDINDTNANTISRLTETQIRALERITVMRTLPNGQTQIVTPTVERDVWLRTRTWTTGATAADGPGYVRFWTFDNDPGPPDDAQIGDLTDLTTAERRGEGIPGNNVFCWRANECNQITTVNGPAPS